MSKSAAQTMCGMRARILLILRRSVFFAVRLEDNLPSVAWFAREMAMSELRQQTIALWIVLMLLMLVPWALE
jgi:hypothetical protein